MFHWKTDSMFQKFMTRFLEISQRRDEGWGSSVSHVTTREFSRGLWSSTPSISPRGFPIKILLLSLLNTIRAQQKKMAITRWRYSDQVWRTSKDTPTPTAHEHMERLIFDHLALLEPVNRPRDGSVFDQIGLQLDVYTYIGCYNSKYRDR